jgi:hypothetical protein
MWTVSAAGGVPGLTVSVEVAVVVPKEVAVMVTWVGAATDRTGTASPSRLGRMDIPRMTTSQCRRNLSR